MNTEGWIVWYYQLGNGRFRRNPLQVGRRSDRSEECRTSAEFVTTRVIDSRYDARHRLVLQRASSDRVVRRDASGSPPAQLTGESIVVTHGRARRDLGGGGRAPRFN